MARHHYSEVQNAKLPAGKTYIHAWLYTFCINFSVHYVTKNPIEGL